MRRSYFFHRDPADAFYTDGAYDCDSCPICGHPLDGMADGKAICPECEVVYDDPADVARVAHDLHAGSTPYSSTNGEW